MELGSYAKIRDRVCADGTHWLKEEVRDFYSGKLAESHTLLTQQQEKKATRRYRVSSACQWIKNPEKIIVQAKRQSRKLTGKLSGKTARA